MSITTILQIYKRPGYLEQQLEAIKNQTIKSDQIFIVHNEGGVKFDNIPKDVQYFYINPNKKFHPRFALGLLVNTEYVVFYDDDTIPQPRWHENCINTIKKHDCLCGTNGRNILPDLRQSCPAGWGNPKDEEVQVDFVGHSWFLRSVNLKYMFYDRIVEFANGEDIMLSANLQIYGNIPTYVPPHPINDRTLWGSDPEKARKFGSDENAHWIKQPTHFEERMKLIEYYKQQGWSLQLKNNKL
jgi:hypothetical protein